MFAAPSQQRGEPRGVPGARLSLGLLLAFTGLLIYGLSGRAAHMDDAWLGEQSYRLLRDGVVRSELFEAYRDHGRRLYVFHKLFIPQGALAIALGGFGLTTLKSVSLVWFAACVGLLAAHLRGALGARWAALGALLLVAHPRVQQYAFIFRPEMNLAVLGLGTWLCVRRAARGDGSAWSLAAGALAGLGLLVHLNGVVFVSGGAVALLVARRRRDALVFAATATLLGCAYCADALLAGQLDVLRDQFLHDPALEERDFSLAGALSKLLLEPLRWLRHGEEIATSALLLVALVAGGRRLLSAERVLLAFVATAALTLGAVAQSHTTKYLVPLVPLVLLVVIAALAAPAPGRSARRGLLTGALWLYLATCATRTIGYVSTKQDVPARSAELLAGIPDGAVVVGDLRLIFDEIERRRLRSVWAFRVLAERRGGTLQLRGLLVQARARGADFVVLDRRSGLGDRLASAWKGEGALELTPPVADALRLRLLDPAATE